MNGLVICPDWNATCDFGQCDHKRPHLPDETCVGKPIADTMEKGSISTHCLHSHACIPFTKKHPLYKKSNINPENWGAHERHCCPTHGCKYGDSDCPVVIEATKKHNEHCEMCEYEYEHPDPLWLLERWVGLCHEEVVLPSRDKYERGMYVDTTVIRVEDIQRVIEEIRQDPRAFAKKARAEGWLE